MLTLAQLWQYEPAIYAILIVGVLITIFGLYLTITKKDKDNIDKFFCWSITIFGIICIGIFVTFAVYSDLTYETITPCSISDKGGLVAAVEGGTYSVQPAEMLKLHINQTRDVIALNGWGTSYPVIKAVPGVNCPSGAASRC